VTRKRRVAKTVASRKGKSRRLQNEVCTLVRAMTGLDDADIKPTPMGVNGIDLQLSSAARAQFPFGVECKNREDLSIWSEFKQCRGNAKREHLIPLLVFTRNYEHCSYAAMATDHFVELQSDQRWSETTVTAKRINLWDLVATLKKPHDGILVVHLARSEEERYTLLRFADLLNICKKCPPVGDDTSKEVTEEIPSHSTSSYI